MKKMLHIGIFETKNLGDLVISQQLSNYLKENKNVKVDFMDFNSLKMVDPSDKTRVKDKNPYKKIRDWPIINSQLTRSIYWKAIELNVAYDEKIYSDYMNCIEEYDIISIGGGNLFYSTSSSIWAIKIAKLIKIAREKNKKVIILSVGAGPILKEKAKKHYAFAVNNCNYISVRDKISANTIRNLPNVNKNIQVAGDPALLLNENQHNSKLEKNGKNIAMSIMPFGKKNFGNLKWYKEYDYYLDMYKNIIAYFCQKNDQYTFNLFSTDVSDYQAIYELYNYIIKNEKSIDKDKINIIPIHDLKSLNTFYEEQDILIGTRMHSLIIAYTQNLPIIAISWQDKVNGFMEYTKLIPYCYNLNEINCNIEQIYQNTIDLIEKKSTYDQGKERKSVKDRFYRLNNQILDGVT